MKLPTPWNFKSFCVVSVFALVGLVLIRFSSLFRNCAISDSEVHDLWHCDIVDKMRSFTIVICEFSVLLLIFCFVAFSGITKYEPEKKVLVSSSLVHFRLLASLSFPYRECVYYCRLQTSITFFLLPQASYFTHISNIEYKLIWL